jgi:hypothetical protein
MKRPVRFAGVFLTLLVVLSPVASFAAAASDSRERPVGEVVGYTEEGGMFIVIAGPFGSPLLVYWVPDDVDPFDEESGFVDR